MTAAVDRLARTLLYEGAMLYPYRGDSLKNRKPFAFGTLEPGGAAIVAELVVECGAPTCEVRYLRGGDEVRAPIAAREVEPGRFRVEVTNATAEPMAAVHIVATGAPFVSLLEPPPAYAALAARAAAANTGVWPVLIDATTMLASPIILYDYPAIAPESPIDLYDATEIDEILTLRILTLSDDEKARIRALDPRARAILERCEALSPDELAALHGARRAPTHPHALYQVGDRVRVRLAERTGVHRTDAMDVVLAGKCATVIEVAADIDPERGTQYALAFDDDPGKDERIGHRFYFRAHELERLA